MGIIRFSVLVACLLSPGGSAAPQTIEGFWRGTLGTGDTAVRLVIGVQRNESGTLSGGVYSIDRGIPNTFDTISLGPDRSVRFASNRLRGRFEGVLSADGREIVGAWIEGDLRRPLTLTIYDNPPPFTMVWAPQVEVFVPTTPVTVKAGGQERLFYEVHITNWSDEEIRLQKLEVLIGADTAVIEGDTLQATTLRRQTRLAPGVRAAVLMFLASGSGFPESIRHRLTFTQPSKSAPVTLENAPTTVSRRVVRIGPPVRGDGWLATNGPDNSQHHRAALHATDGHITNAQRFAFDFSRRPASQGTRAGDPWDLQRSPSYGAEVVAVADGTIVSARNDIPDSVPYDITAAVPLTRDTVLGNAIVLDLGDGRYATYAHLQVKSVRVKAGDAVRRGQVLGLIGNSGGTDAPHLHFHVSDGRDPLASEGVPFVFDSFTRDGVTYRDEMPLGDWVLSFR